jgi:hypothetical protein
MDGKAWIIIVEWGMPDFEIDYNNVKKYLLPLKKQNGQ